MFGDDAGVEGLLCCVYGRQVDCGCGFEGSRWLKLGKRELHFPGDY